MIQVVGHRVCKAVALLVDPSQGLTFFTLFHDSTSYFYLRAEERRTVLPTSHFSECFDLRMHRRFLAHGSAGCAGDSIKSVDADHGNCFNEYSDIGKKNTF